MKALCSAILPFSEIHTALPFTVSHAAAFLPFRKLNLVWSAFMIGSMAPDFPYMIGTTKYRDLGHHFPGVVFFTVPASFVALWLFHNVIKRPVIGLMPSVMQARLRGQDDEFRFAGDTRLRTISVSVVLGIATHLVWDSFTHSFTWPWREFRFLHQRMQLPILGAVPGFAVMQYGSTFAGMLALAIWVWLWYRRAAPAAENVQGSRVNSRFALAVTMFMVAGSVGLTRAVLMVGTPANRGEADRFFLIFAVTAIALAFWELVLYCVLVTSRQIRTL